MSQFDFGTIDPNVKTGTQLALDLNQWRDALHSGHAGAARPSYAQPGMLWVKQVTSTDWRLMLFSAAGDIEIGAMNPTTLAVTPSALYLATTQKGAANGVASLNASAQLPLAQTPDSLRVGRNAIIGGDFTVNPWQRGTTFSAIAHNAHFADRWLYLKGGTMVHNIFRGAAGLIAANAGVTGYAQLACVTADAAMAAGDFCFIGHRIEGYNFARLAQIPLVLSFWVNAPKAGIYSVQLNNHGADRVVCMEYTVSVPGVWEYKTVAFPASPSAGTWDFTTGIGLALWFGLAGGSDFFAASNGSWITPSGSMPKISANQVNSVDATGNFYIALVQLEAGTVATPCERRAFGDELLLCQRYYEKSYDLATLPGTAVYPGVAIAHQMNTLLAGNSYINPQFKVRKRATPTIAVYAPQTGLIGNFSDNSGVNTAATVLATGEAAFYARNSAAATALPMFAHWTASSEL